MPSHFQNMSGPDEISRKAHLNIRLSEFEMPPTQDVLLVGKKAPIGSEAVRRMVNAVSPDQYEVIRLEHKLFESVVLKRSLLRQISQEKLLEVILEEGERIATAEMVVKAQISLVIQVNRGIDL